MSRMKDISPNWSVFHVNDAAGEAAPFEGIAAMTRREAEARAADIRSGYRGSPAHGPWSVRALAVADAEPRIAAFRARSCLPSAG